jgi:hypothetical protein
MSESLSFGLPARIRQTAGCRIDIHRWLLGFSVWFSRFDRLIEHSRQRCKRPDSANDVSETDRPFETELSSGPNDVDDFTDS